MEKTRAIYCQQSPVVAAKHGVNRRTFTWTVKPYHIEWHGLTSIPPHIQRSHLGSHEVSDEQPLTVGLGTVNRLNLRHQFVNLPDFIWLWKIAAWSMGLSLAAYLLLAVTGSVLFSKRHSQRPRPKWLRPLHYIIGWLMVTLVLLLLAIGLVGTIGHYGNLGHSGHLIAGLSVVALVAVSAGSSTQISPQKPWARAVHLGTNIALFLGFAWVSYSGWQVVQKYL